MSNTLTHSLAQGFGWVLGSFGAIVSAVLLLSARKLFANPLTALPLKQQHRLFQGYWNHLEKKERYEEMEALTDTMLAYQEGKQPTRKQLKPYKLVTKKSLKMKGDDFKFITKRYIARA